MELLSTMIAGINVGSALCSALAAIGLKALSDAAEISRDAREHGSDRR